MGSDNNTHFTCVMCGKRRDRKRELSHQSRKAIGAAEKIATLKPKDRAKLEYCRSCVNDNMASGSMPPALAAWLGQREAAARSERKVTPDEAGETRQPEPVHNDHLLTYDEAASISGIPKGTLTFWAHDGVLPKTYVGEARRRDVRIKLSDLLRVLEERKDKYQHPRVPMKQSRYLQRIATAVSAKRQEQGLSRDAVAKQMGVSATTIADIESGERKWVTPQVFGKLKRWLGPDLAAVDMADKPAPTAPAPAATNGHSTIVVQQPIMVDPPADDLKALAPWEAAAEMKRREELQATVAAEVERVVAERVKPLEEHNAALELQNEAVLEWIGKHRQAFPDWPGWAELDTIIGEAQAVEGAA